MNFQSRHKTVGNCFTLLLVCFGVLVRIVKSSANHKIVLGKLIFSLLAYGAGRKI